MSWTQNSIRGTFALAQRNQHESVSGTHFPNHTWCIPLDNARLTIGTTLLLFGSAVRRRRVLLSASQAALVGVVPPPLLRPLCAAVRVAAAFPRSSAPLRIDRGREKGHEGREGEEQRKESGEPPPAHPQRVPSNSTHTPHPPPPPPSLPLPLLVALRDSARPSDPCGRSCCRSRRCARPFEFQRATNSRPEGESASSAEESMEPQTNEDKQTTTHTFLRTTLTTHSAASRRRPLRGISGSHSRVGWRKVCKRMTGGSLQKSAR